MEYWIVYDLATGEELYTGSGSAGTADYQKPPEGTGVVGVPFAVVRQMPRDLAALRNAVSIAIDNAAEQIRARYVTALPAQVGTYLLKEAAARGWLADEGAPTIMLQPEAAARGMTITELAAEVIANADAWARLAGAIEGLRFAGKTQVAAATTIGAIVAAGAIDWEVLHAPAA